MQLIALLSVPVPAFLGAQHQPRWPPFAPRRGGKHVKAATHIPKNAELSIWSFDPMSKQLKTRWVNEDGSEPATHLGNTQDVLVFTGDDDSFRSTFGPANYVHLVFVRL